MLRGSMAGKSTRGTWPEPSGPERPRQNLVTIWIRVDRLPAVVIESSDDEARWIRAYA